MNGGWQAVDEHIAEKLLGDDDVLATTLANNAAHGLPPIDVSAAQGKMLFLLAESAARRDCGADGRSEEVGRVYIGARSLNGRFMFGHPGEGRDLTVAI